ncbi:MAG: aminotransferase class I/II-fold pyridoxal phosphate-dependent enzyme [Candidatus Omnitrophica bacterium]|nr:aminotransferase class I/II-fold pyridoxal phosphate-dependent enzyme [Candidatus Omnitrophota bacterium]
MSTIYKTIYLDAPSIGAAEKRYLSRAVDTGYVSSAGRFVFDFEEAFARYVGSRNAVATQSGTAALHMALHELKIGRGDEVIVPALTFIASINPVLYVGARPVFADIDSRTWNIDPCRIERLINRRTKAILPVHLYGNPCDMGAIMRIARKHGLAVIEDATESLGATYKGRQTGTFGDFGCFSFNGNKIITTGGGGMVVSRDAGKAGHIKFLVNQAKDKANSLYHPEMGFNYRMTNIEAALGLAQLKKINRFLASKNRINSIYREKLGGIKTIRFQEECDGGRSSNWFTCVSFADGINIARLQKKLMKHNIPTRRIFMPATGFPPYRKYGKGDYSRSRGLYDRGLCLPSSVMNTKDDIYRVTTKLKELIA